MSESQRRAVVALGRNMGPDIVAAVYQIYDDDQRVSAAAHPPAATDLAYGPAERNRLDVYTPLDSPATDLPVLLFVHGGGFVTGDKGSTQSWQNANVGRMAAKAGFVGVVMNYRLAPDHMWPAGAEDVAAAVAWVREHVADYGGDASKIVLVGTSAGAIHVASYLKLRPDDSDVRGAALLSGLYGYTPPDAKDAKYYGPEEHYADRCPRSAVVKTALPLLVALTEYDPPRFQSEFLGLLGERLLHHGNMPRACIVSGHNHYSSTMHLGTDDTRLADEIIAFIKDVTA